MRLEEVFKKIDHTLLRADASESDVTRLCEEAEKYGFYAVCINPYYVPLAVKLLRNSEVKVCTVIGFPLGATLTEVKAVEAERAVSLGASEVDMVMNISAFKSRDLEYFRNDIREVRRRIGEAVLKVIIECCYLSDEEKVLAAKIAEEEGADYIKTSTGFGPSGASIKDVKLLRSSLKPETKIKAAGGIRSFDQVLEFIEAGADRIGTSSSVKIAEEGLKRAHA